MSNALFASLLPNDPAARSVIRAEAAKRDLTSAQLLQRLVVAIAADRLVGAVLDDGDEKGDGTEYHPVSRGRP